jgi:hypothetical protein
MLEAFKNENITASAFWKWDYQDADTASFNLVLNQNGTITPTEYYTFLKNSVSNIYGDSLSSSASTSNNTSTTDPASESESESNSNSTEEN